VSAFSLVVCDGCYAPVVDPPKHNTLPLWTSSDKNAEFSEEEKVNGEILNESSSQEK
jgi:hypothetical protein